MSEAKCAGHCFVCGSCAQSCDNVKMIQRVVERGTCVLCRKKRYGYLCEVGKR